MASAFLLVLWTSLLPTATPERPGPTVSEPLPPVVTRGEPVDTLVFCAPALRSALQPWIDYRTEQGHHLVVTTKVDSSDMIRATIKQVAQLGGLHTVVLVGDIQHADGAHGAQVPTCVLPAEIIKRWGPDKDIASDQGFADLDNDGRPEYAIGRMSVDTPEQLQSLTRKIKSYEQQPSSGVWRQRINLIAGVGGFGVLADAVLETAVRSCLTRGIPPEYRTSMTYASWRSPYCPDPRSFRNVTLERLNEGCFCWVYIGHGHPNGLDLVRVPTGVAPILNVNDVHRVDCPEGPPIAVFLSCYAGAFDGAQDCLAERLLQNERGPVAVLAGSRMTMPYGMTVLSDALMHQMFQQKQATIGDLVLVAKQQVWEGASQGGSSHPWMDAVARALSPKPHDLPGEQREHLRLFNLFGDPLLRIAHPEPLDLHVPSSVAPGEMLEVRGEADIVGRCQVELSCRRGRLTFQPIPRTSFDGSDEGLRALDDVYRQANEDRYAKSSFEKSAKQFSTKILVPEDVRGPCTVRVFVQGKTAFAMGSAALQVKVDQEAAAKGDQEVRLQGKEAASSSDSAAIEGSQRPDGDLRTSTEKVSQPIVPVRRTSSEGKPFRNAVPAPPSLH